MPHRSWPEGSIASSVVTSSLSLGQRGKWQRGLKDHYKPLLHWGTSFRTCMVQVPLAHPQGTEELLPAVLRAVPWPRATPTGIPGHLQAPLGAEGGEGSTVHSSSTAAVWQVCYQNLSHTWASPLIKVHIFPTGCGSLHYSLILLPPSFSFHHTHAILVFILKHKCSPLSKLPGYGMFYAFFIRSAPMLNWDYMMSGFPCSQT